MNIALIIALINCLFLILSILFFPKVKVGKVTVNTYWVICIIDAILMIIFNQISFNEVIDVFSKNNSINPLKILILFFCMTLLSIYLDEIGFFSFIANKMISHVKSSQMELFAIIYALVSILTIFTSNDVVILTFTPFICCFCKKANIRPIPYLVSIFAAANTWSMFLLIGNPTNIYLATSANINFIEYIKVMFLPTLIAGIFEFLILVLIFKKSLKEPISVYDHEHNYIDKINLYIGLTHLIVCILFLTISSYIVIEMYLITLICASSLIICILISHIIRKQKLTDIKETIKRLPWELIPFVLSMFIIVIALNNSGISNQISNLITSKNITFKYGIISYLSANLMNNIPMSVFFSTIPHFTDISLQYKAIYSIIIGSNIGAFLTPIGALAGIMFMQLLKKYNLHYKISDYVKYGIIISLPTILISLIVLDFVL